MTSVEPYRGQAAAAAQRERVARLLGLAEHLEKGDRLLVEHVYLHGRAISELAKMNRQPVRTLQVRLSRLLKRMTGAEYQFLAMRSHLLDPATRSIARRVVCRGQTYRGAARNLGVSLYRVRAHMRYFHTALNSPVLTERADRATSLAQVGSVQ